MDMNFPNLWWFLCFGFCLSWELCVLIFHDSLGFFGREISPFSFTVVCTSALYGLSYWACFFLLWICVAMLGSGGSGWCWSRMVSWAPKWRLPAREHCRFCTPHAASGFRRYLSESSHMRIYFQGRTIHAHIEFAMKNLFPYCGVDWDPLLGFCAQICKGKETPMWPREVSSCPWSPQLGGEFTIQAVNVSVSPEQSTPLGFPRLKPWVKRWEHPFHTDMAPSFLSPGSSFFLPESKSFCNWHLPSLDVGGEVGKPWWPAWSLGLLLLQVWAYNNLSISQMGTRLFWGGVELPAHLST